MEKLFRINELNFETNLKFEDVIKIAEMFIETKNEPYEIDQNNVLYDTRSHVTNKAVWYVDVISLKVKQKWPEAYDTLAISDKER